MSGAGEIETDGRTLAARELILAAVRAGGFEEPVDPKRAAAILKGADMRLENLNFDSLGWMEFCISVEVNSGLELTPGLVEAMETVADVESWLVARLPG